MMRKTVEELRCSNGENCVAYPALGEPAKLSRGNPGMRCFACEDRRAASELRTAAAKSKIVELRKAKEPPWAKSNELKENVGREYSEAEQRAREVLERRRRSVFTCEGGMRLALARGDDRLVRRWSRSLREAEQRLAWAEADLANLTRAEKGVWSEPAS
jgi:hypothetical protein